MLLIVTSYLIQARSCALPGIGRFDIISKPAELDIVHKQIHPPIEEVVFEADENVVADEGLVKYVATKRIEDEETAALVLNNYCEEWKYAISRGEVINIPVFGSLQKNAVGSIYFRKLDGEIQYRDPVQAERVIRENVDHPILVGDKETSSNRMTDYYTDTTPEKRMSLWPIWTGLLAIIALGFLYLHFRRNDFNFQNFGNERKITVDSFAVEKISKDIK